MIRFSITFIPLDFAGLLLKMTFALRLLPGWNNYMPGWITCSIWESMPFIWGRYLNPPPMVMTRPIISGWTAGWEAMKHLADLSAGLHQKGIRLILDGVFNHVGRDFWAFRDVLEHREQSALFRLVLRVEFSAAQSLWGSLFL